MFLSGTGRDAALVLNSGTANFPPLGTSGEQAADYYWVVYEIIKVPVVTVRPFQTFV